MDELEGNNPPGVGAGFVLRLPNRLGCEVAVALGVVRVGGLAWELFKLEKREAMVVEWEVGERKG